MPEAAQGVLRTNFEFSCDMPYDEIDDENPQAGGTVAAALGEILKGLGCEVGEVADGGDHGWYLDFNYRGVSPTLEVTAIYGIVVQVHGPRLTGLLGGSKPPNPDYVEILTRLGEAIQADPRFHDLGWFTKEEFLSRQVGALTPLGAYDSALCMRYFGPEGEDEPYVRPPPFEPDAALVASGWSDLTPHPHRRFVARAFDFSVVGGGLSLAVLWMIAPLWSSSERLETVLGLYILTFPVRVVASIAINATLIARLSSTPGKWLCGVKVFREEGPWTFRESWSREFNAVIWSGFYIPVLGWILMLDPYADLRKRGKTSYDLLGGFAVVQRPNSASQYFLSLLAAAAVLGQLLFWNEQIKSP